MRILFLRTSNTAPKWYSAEIPQDVLLGRVCDYLNIEGDVRVGQHMQARSPESDGIEFRRLTSFASTLNTEGDHAAYESRKYRIEHGGRLGEPKSVQGYK